MALADSGGFDLVLELSLTALEREIQPIINAALPDQSLPVAGWGTLTFHPQLTLTQLQLHPDTSVTVGVSTAGTSLSWPAVVWNGITLSPAGSQQLSFGVTLTARPQVSGNAISINFPSDAATVQLGPGTLEAIPGVLAWLSLIGTVQGATAREAERQRLYSVAQTALAAPINAALPDSVPLGSLPSPPVHGALLVASGNELRVLMTIGGTPGNPNAITRSAIRRDPGGAPLDIAGVIVGNHCLLRDILAPLLTAGLGLPASGFSTAFPGIWTGNAALPPAATVAGVTPSVRVVFSGIDRTGALTATMRFDGQHSTGAFGITGALTLSLTPTITGSGSNRALTISVGSSVVTDLDVWVAWWVYVGGIFVSPLLTLAIGLTDAFAGGGLAATINGAVRGALGSGTLSLPLPSGPIGATSLSTAQADAAIPILSLPGLSIPLPPENDVILTIG